MNRKAKNGTKRGVSSASKRQAILAAIPRRRWVTYEEVAAKVRATMPYTRRILRVARMHEFKLEIRTRPLEKGIRALGRRPIEMRRLA